MLKSENRPAILHCSAGVGRAGSYVVTDIEIEKMLAEGNVDIFKAVSTVRQFRSRLVQVSAQYVFIHQVLVDAFINKVSICRYFLTYLLPIDSINQHTECSFKPVGSPH